MNGIMSGIQDRKNYAVGPENPSVDSSRFKEILEEHETCYKRKFTCV